MACLIDSGVQRTCEFSAGGLNSLYIANYEDVDTLTVDASGEVTAIVFKTATPQPGFFDFGFLKDTASFVQELVVSEGQKFYNQTLTFNLSQRSELTSGTPDGEQTPTEAQNLVALMDKLVLGKFIAVAGTKAGTSYLLGKLNGLEASASTLNSGAAGGDFSGYNITLNSEEIEGAPVVTEDITPVSGSGV